MLTLSFTPQWEEVIRIYVRHTSLFCRISVPRVKVSAGEGILMITINSYLLHENNIPSDLNNSLVPEKIG